jgi:hypothetical protein
MATFGTFVDDVSLKATELNDCFRLSSTVPSLTQSATMALSTTSSRASAFTVNKLVIFTCYLQIQSGSGSSGTRIEVSLPVTAASNSVRVIGGGRFVDSSTTEETLLRAVQVSTTKIAFLTETTNSLTAYLGQTNGPNTALATSDVIQCFVMYEAA